MSDEIGHHCGIALVRLRKPLAYYEQKYGTPLWGFNQLFLLMEKQHNRGQDGAGIGSMKLNMPPGEAFMFRERSTSTKALSKIFGGQHKKLEKMIKDGIAFPEFPEICQHESQNADIHGFRRVPGKLSNTCQNIQRRPAGRPSENCKKCTRKAQTY